MRSQSFQHAFLLVPFLLLDAQVLGYQSNERRIAAPLGNSLEPRNIFAHFRNCEGLNSKPMSGLGGSATDSLVDTMPSATDALEPSATDALEPSSTADSVEEKKMRRQFRGDSEASVTGGPAGPSGTITGAPAAGTASKGNEKFASWCAAFSSIMNEHVGAFDPEKDHPHFRGGPPNSEVGASVSRPAGGPLTDAGGPMTGGPEDASATGAALPAQTE